MVLKDLLDGCRDLADRLLRPGQAKSRRFDQEHRDFRQFLFPLGAQCRPGITQHLHQRRRLVRRVIVLRLADHLQQLVEYLADLVRLEFGHRWRLLARVGLRRARDAADQWFQHLVEGVVR